MVARGRHSPRIPGEMPGCTQGDLPRPDGRIRWRILEPQLPRSTGSRLSQLPVKMPLRLVMAGDGW